MSVLRWLLAPFRWLRWLILWLRDRLAYGDRGPLPAILMWLTLVLVSALPFYYAIGIALTHTIDDSLEPVDAVVVPAGGSHGVAVAEALVRREIEGNGWVANDPWFRPCTFCDNMANYQSGMVAALARFTQAVETLNGGGADEDLSQAASLTEPPDLWVWEPSRSPWPQASSEALYLNAAAALGRYNTRLSEGSAVFDRGPTGLFRLVNASADDLSAAITSLSTAIRDTRGGLLFDWRSDDLFYRTKGQAYGHAMVLRALARDFKAILSEKAIESDLQNAVALLDQVVAMKPWIVVNARPDSQLLPNHLTTQGFYLLQAEAALRDLAARL